MFQYTISNDQTKTIVFFEGDMDIEMTEIMEENIMPDLLTCKEIEIDFSKVPFVDSSGIGLLITLIQKLQEHDIKVMIASIVPDVKEVFSMLQIPDILGREVFLDY